MSPRDGWREEMARSIGESDTMAALDAPSISNLAE